MKTTRTLRFCLTARRAMSKRRQVGDWVWLVPYSGFVGESHRLKAEIQPEDPKYATPCMENCGDDDCREWVELLTEPDPMHGGARHVLYHVPECRMLDQQWSEASEKSS
jgi:hypothetical protein